tara:strand:- start:177 stop:638 length:462 start_codon:yes stop_codon:yes gene_type:complete
MIKLFDIKNPMGRKEYFFSLLIRFACITIIIGLVLVVASLSSIQGEWTEEAIDASLEWMQGNLFLDVFINLAVLTILIPIDIRRALDIRIDIKWIIASWIPTILTPQLIFQHVTSPGILVFIILLYMYSGIISLALLFKSGETYKTYIRGRKN